MGGLFLVLLLVVIISGGIPLVLFAYSRGRLKIPKRPLLAIIFCGVVVAAMLEFPLNISCKSPVSFLGALIVYVLGGIFLRREYTKSKWRFCMLFVFFANCVGVMSKCLIFYFGMVRHEPIFTFMDIGKFLIIVQIVVSLAFFSGTEKEPQKTYQPKKREK